MEKKFITIVLLLLIIYLINPFPSESHISPLLLCNNWVTLLYDSVSILISTLKLPVS